MKAKRTMSRFLCDSPTVERGAFTQTCYADTGFAYRTDDDRDSGTESDDEGAEIEELQKYMETIIHLDSGRHHSLQRRTKRLSQVTNDLPPPPPPPTHHHHRRRTHYHPSSTPDSALPSDSDLHHSSEEELEVINSSSSIGKRKWVGGQEVEDAVRLPLQFRTDPPEDAYKPSWKCVRQAHIPPHELCAVSPRKRHRRTPVGGGNVQRPHLDFEKMQQINRVRLL